MLRAQPPTLQDFFAALGSEKPIAVDDLAAFYAQMSDKDVLLAKQILGKLPAAEKIQHVHGILQNPGLKPEVSFNEFLIPLLEQTLPPLAIAEKSQLLYALTKHISDNTNIEAFNQRFAPDRAATSAEPAEDIDAAYQAALEACKIMLAQPVKQEDVTQRRILMTRSTRTLLPISRTAPESKKPFNVTEAMLNDIDKLKQALLDAHENDVHAKLAEIERILANDKQRNKLGKSQRSELKKLYKQYLETLAQELRQASAILFLNIPSEELSNIKDPKPDSIQQLTRAYNTLTNYITEEITFANSKAERALIMERWVAILQRSIDLGNFTFASAIHVSFDAVPVARFNITENLSAQAQKVLEDLRYNDKSVLTYYGLRISQDRTDQYIPHYGWYISLFTINDGKVDETQGKEQIERLNLADKIIEKKDWADAVILLTRLISQHQDSLEKDGRHEAYVKELERLALTRKETDARIDEIEKRILAAHANPAEAKRLKEEELAPLNKLKSEQDEALAALKSKMRDHITEINPQDPAVKELAQTQSQQRTDLEEIKADLKEISQQLGSLSTEKTRIKNRINEGNPQAGDHERLDAIGVEFKAALVNNRRRQKQLNQLLIDGSEQMLSDDRDFWAGELRRLNEKYQNAYAGFKKANDEVISELSRKQQALLPKPAAATLSPFTRSIMEGRSDDDIREVDKRCEMKSKPFKDDSGYKSAKCGLLKKKNYKKFILTEESSTVENIPSLLKLVFTDKDELIKQLKAAQSGIESVDLKRLVTDIYVLLGNGNISPLEKLEFLRKSIQQFDAQEHREIFDILARLIRLHEDICGMAAQQSAQTLSGLRNVRIETSVDVDEAYIRELIHGHPEWSAATRAKMIEIAFSNSAVQQFLMLDENQALRNALTRVYEESPRTDESATLSRTSIPLVKQPTRLGLTRSKPKPDIQAHIKERLLLMQKKMYQERNPCSEELQQLISDGPIARDVREHLHKNQDLFRQFQRLYEQSVDIIADSLVAYDAQLFSQLNTHELYRDPARDALPTLQPCIDFLNNLSGYVIDDIQSRSSLNERTLAMEHWIRVAYKCLHHSVIPDMHLAFCFSTTFANAGITRLKAAEAGLSQQALAMLKDIESITSPFGSFKDARSFLTDHPHACPSMSLIFSDMEFFSKGNQDISPRQLQGVQNYVEKLNLRISEIHQRQVEWKFVPDPALIQSIHAPHQTGSEQGDKASRLQDAEKSQTKSTILTDFDFYPMSRIETATRSVPIPGHQPKAPRTRSDKLVIILHDENLEQIHQLGFLPGCEFVLVSDSPRPDLPGSVRQITRAEITIDRKPLDALLEEKKQSYAASQDDRIKLYSLVVYGEERTIDLNNISSTSRQKIEAAIGDTDFVEHYFERAKPLLEKHFTSLYLQETLHTPQRDIIDIEEYALAVINHNQHYLLNPQDLTDDDPLKKAIAMLYLGITQPDWFTPAGSDDDRIRVEKKNRCDSVEVIFSRLDESDIQKIKKWLESPRPGTQIDSSHIGEEPGQTLFDSLPEAIKETLGKQYHRDIHLAKTVGELYQTEHDFIRQMQVFVGHFCDENGNLKPESAFLTNKDQKLTAQERVLLAHFLEPYKVLARDTLGSKPDNHSDAIRHFSGMLNQDHERRKAFVTVAANQVAFQALISHLNKDAFQRIPYVRSGSREADASYLATSDSLAASDFPIMPVQRMPRIELFTRDLLKIAPKNDRQDIEAIQSFAASISVESQAAASAKTSQVGSQTSEDIYHSLQKKIMQDQNASIQQSLEQIKRNLPTLKVSDSSHSNAIEAAVSALAKYGLEKDSRKDIHVYRKNMVREILSVLSSMTSAVDMLHYLGRVLQSESRLREHKKDRKSETSIIHKLNTLHAALQKAVGFTQAEKQITSVSPPQLLSEPTHELTSAANPSASNHGITPLDSLSLFSHHEQRITLTQQEILRTTLMTLDVMIDSMKSMQKSYESMTRMLETSMITMPATTPLDSQSLTDTRDDTFGHPRY